MKIKSDRGLIFLQFSGFLAIGAYIVTYGQWCTLAFGAVITIPSIGPLRRKYVFEMTKTAIFSNIFSIPQPLTFWNCLFLYQVDT